jgi:signal transduction histidine kinase
MFPSETAAGVIQSSELPQHLRRLYALGGLAGGIARDINNLLSVMMVYAEIVQRQMPPGEPKTQLVAEIIKSADRASELTRQLLPTLHAKNSGRFCVKPFVGAISRNTFGSPSFSRNSDKALNA